MKINRLIGMVAGTMLVSCNQLNNEFTITSQIGGGLEKGTIVTLTNIEGDSSRDWVVLACDTVENGVFQLKGSVASPTLCSLAIKQNKVDEKGKSYEVDAKVTLMVENLPISIEAAHLDSIPLAWERGKSPLMKERNVTVKGGKAQMEYNELRERLIDPEIEEYKARQEWLQCFYRTKNRDSMAVYENVRKQKHAVVDQIKEDFLQEHPDYSISMWMLHKKMKEYFGYTPEELDGLLAKVSTTTDTLRLRKMKETVEKVKEHAKGVAFRDFTVLTEKNEQKRFSDFHQPGTCTLIDFWASWCGPCRAAIPHVKELHEKYGDKLNIFSVSTDESDAAWRKALKEENMPWTQLVLPKEGDTRQEAYDRYKFTGIPCLVVIDAEGRILCATHIPDKVSKILEETIQ